MKKTISGIFAISLFVVAGVLATGCQDAPSAGEPAQRLKIPQTVCVGGFAGDAIYATGVEPWSLLVWRWHDGTLKNEHRITLENGYPNVWLGDGAYLFSRKTEAFSSILCRQTANEPEPKLRWEIPSDWYCTVTGRSRNGAYTALGFEYGGSDPGMDVTRETQIKIAFLGPGSTKPSWDVTVSGRNYGNNPEALLPSDDGRFVAIASWHHGVAMVDMQTKELLWSARPPSEISANYAAFSADSKIIYAGGGEGCVYGMDVRTGSIISRWVATDSGRSEYGGQITCIAASGDGNWVAAGTGPAQVVYLFSSQTGKIVRRIQHAKGGSPHLVAFSPDSSALAVLSSNKISVWKVPTSSSGP